MSRWEKDCPYLCLFICYLVHTNLLQNLYVSQGLVTLIRTTSFARKSIYKSICKKLAVLHGFVEELVFNKIIIKEEKIFSLTGKKLKSRWNCNCNILRHHPKEIGYCDRFIGWPQSAYILLFRTHFHTSTKQECLKFTITILTE